MKVVIDLMKLYIKEGDPLEVFSSNQADVLVCKFFSDNSLTLRVYLGKNSEEISEYLINEIRFVSLTRAKDLVILEKKEFEAENRCEDFKKIRRVIAGFILELSLHKRGHCALLYLYGEMRLGGMLDFVKK